MHEVLERLRQRKLGQWALAYLAGAWVLLQVLDLIGNQFDWPTGFLRGITVVLGVGFLVTLVLAWYHGERGAQKVSSTELLMLALLLAIGGGLLWRFVPSPVVPAGRSPSVVAKAVTADRRSIAVLPFADMSQAGDQGYFSDGLAEELLNLLAKVPQLRVIARTSSFSFKGKDTPLAEIGRQLQVASVLEGSVRKSGDRLRITTKLIDVADGIELWSQTYDRQLTDVFALQDEIASSVVEALKIKLLPQQRATSARPRTDNPDAYDQYLLGRQYYIRSNVESWHLSAEAYAKAIALDPDFAAAYAGHSVAEIYASQSAETPAAVEEGQRKAAIAAEKAIALDPELAQGYMARALVRLIINLDWSGAEEDFRHGLLLDPADIDLLRRYGNLLSSLGRMPEAIAMYNKAAALDPLFAPAWNSLGYQLIAAGQLETARQALNRALALNPGNRYISYNLAVTSLLERDPAAARAQFERIPADHFLHWTGIAVAEHDLGHAAQSQQALETLIALPARPAFWVAGVYAWRGESDQAFAWLDRAHTQRDVFLPQIKIDPLLRKLHGDPRFAAMVKKVGLPP